MGELKYTPFLEDDDNDDVEDASKSPRVRCSLMPLPIPPSSLLLLLPLDDASRDAAIAAASI